MEKETKSNSFNLKREGELTKLNSDGNDDLNSKKKLKTNIRPRNKISAIKDKKLGRMEKKKYQISQAELAEKEQIKLKNDIKNIFKSSQFISHNLKSLQKELKINDTIVAIISTIIILLSFIQVFNLIEYLYDINDVILTLRTCIMILSIPNSTLVTSGLIKMFVVELIINIIQPFPYLESIIEMNHGQTIIRLSLSHFSLLFCVLRIYLSIKLIDHYNAWTNTRSKRIGNLLGFKPGSFFVIKVMLKNSPLKIITILSVFFIAALAMLLRAFEYFDVVLGNQSFSWFWNALWLNIITMTTIGYGDMTPLTDLGKLFCIISCIFGIFLLSMLVAVITLMITLDDDELLVYKKISEKDIIYENLSKEVKSVFNLLGELYKKRKTNQIDKDSMEYKQMKLLLHFRLQKLNEKTRLLGMVDFSMDKLLSGIEAEIENHMTDILSESLKILSFEKRFYAIMNNQVTLENRCMESKNIANKISNLATFISTMSTCGIIDNIIEGGRLYSNGDIISENQKRLELLKKYHFNS